MACPRSIAARPIPAPYIALERLIVVCAVAIAQQPCLLSANDNRDKIYTKLPTEVGVTAPEIPTTVVWNHTFIIRMRFLSPA